MALEFPLYDTLVKNSKHLNSAEKIDIPKLASKISKLDGEGRITLVAILIYHKKQGCEAPEIVLDYDISLNLTEFSPALLAICDRYCDMHISLMKEQRQRERLVENLN